MDYKFKTTFWQDFTIADAFGLRAVRDTFDRAYREWRSDVMYVTELALVLNWKCWEHYGKGNMELSDLYHDFFYIVDWWCLDHLEDDDLAYYLKTID